MSARNAAIATTALLFAGCSSMPELEVGYYLPEVTTSIKVVQTAACTKSGIPIVAVSDPEFTSIYKRRPGPPETIDLARLDGAFTKSSMTIQYFEDGRLKSINGTQTGSGAEGVKTLISLISLAGFLEFNKDDAEDACKTLKSLLTGDKKSLTITHSGQTSFDPNDPVIIGLDQSDVTDDIYQSLAPIFGTVSAGYELLPDHKTFVDNTPYDPNNPDATDGDKLSLVEPARVKLSVFITRGKKSKVSDTIVLVPQRGTPYTLPIQSPPTFGENKIELVLGEAGNVEKLSYTGGGGGPGVLTSISDFAKETEGDTAAEKAAKIKAEADLIYEQRRLVECQISPDDCPK